ncbi:MAG: AAA family ATPase [Candidatus Ancillula sp.]|jgi:DNA repair protein RecN (Recombination protein N)|nr:AAA family ATPase [Candidatus Ancillula sp.]
MLETLILENVGPIRKAELNFDSGLNVITGETGAGKSMLLTGVDLISGNNPSRLNSLKGTIKISASAVFFSKSEEIIIERYFDPESNRLKGKYNNKPATASYLKDEVIKLLQIHGQSEQMKLLKSNYALSLVDKYGKINDSDYIQAKNSVISIQAKIEDLEDKIANSDRKIDELKQFIEKFENVNPKPEEDIIIKNRINKIQNIANFATGLHQVLSILEGVDFDSDSVLSMLKTACQSLSGISQYDSKIEKLSERLDSSLLEIQDIARELANVVGELEVEPGELDVLNERYSNITSLTKYYNMDLEELINKYSEACDELGQLQKPDNYLEKLTIELESAQINFKKADIKLKNEREKAAKNLANAVTEQFVDLALSGASFIIEVVDTETINFLYQPHKSVAPGNISKIASGGELSRIQLALEIALLQNVDQENENSITYIFDEVDAGIGGKAAIAVANKLKLLSQTYQIVVVTHLATVAAVADKHFFVNKEIETGETLVKQLDYNQRIEELARLLSGEVTKASLEHAKELLS